LANAPTFGSHLNFDDSATLPVWLSQAGYTTGLFGKDRTQPNLESTYATQNTLQPPPGWDTYFAGLGSGPSGFGTRFTDNGTLLVTGQQDYNTDVIRDRMLEFVGNANVASPFFAYFATFSPHAPGTPAPRHDHAFDGLVAPRTPNYLVMPPGVAVPNADALALADTNYREGTESLLAVDEAIAALVQSLTVLHELDNTVIIFTSDNGHGYGEHGVLGKNTFWEESIRVPLLIWDGRSRVGQHTSSLATNVDITATVMDLAGAAKPPEFDGLSLVPVMSNPTAVVRGDMLLTHQDNSRSQVGVRNSRWVYNEMSTGSRFLFDVVNDPYELENLVDNPNYASVQA
jgi:arylsulfatase A-like enzyme